jgi:hypothetical protein
MLIELDRIGHGLYAPWKAMSTSQPIVIPTLPKLTHKSPLYRDGWISFMICGKSGCGKTSLMAELVPGISDKIRFICIATMVYRNPFHLAIKDWAAKTKRVCVISSSPEDIRGFVEGLHRQGWLQPGEQELLLIFDDFSINHRSGSKPENLVVEAFTRWRNLGVNIVIICQDASMVATSCRNCTNMRVLFNSGSKTALQTFTKDMIDRVPDAYVFHDLIRYITSIPYSYILVQENPLEVSVGNGVDLKKVMNESNVLVPTYRELMAEVGASTPAELREMSVGMQKKMGNTAPELFTGTRSSGRCRTRPAEASDSDGSSSDSPSEGTTSD